MPYRFHILGVPHTISIKEYSACAFTQKIVKLCTMLKSRGHTVFHYGHEDSHVDCDEKITVTKRYDLYKSYGDHDWRKKGFPPYRLDDHVYKTFYAKTIAELEKRKKPGDFLLCPFGGNHKPVADAHPDMIVCEPGIGYPEGGFAKFRVFESYAIMHAYLGQPVIKAMSNERWYDVVIPNYFDLEDFEFSAEKDDYFLFVGRINPGKGIHIALQIVEEVGGRLIIAGPGGLTGHETRTDRPVSEYAELLGVVGPDERKRLMARAKATLAPSTFMEPFCGVQIESMLSGTPVISSDWGAFGEYNIHGVTGYRCRTFEQFTWAARNIHTIDPHACRSWAARNFSLERVADMYDEYFFSVHNIFSGKGWYQQNGERKNLDWLRKYYPPEPAVHPGASNNGEGALAKSEACSTGGSIERATKTIGLCMIVRNESKIILRCLESVRSIVDYVLIEDTGSTDGTQAIIREWLDRVGLPGEVYDEPWQDFAYNRSHALARLREHKDIDYALILDADDHIVFEPGFDVAAFKNSLSQDAHDVQLREGLIRYRRGQICSNRRAFRYRGVLHEFMERPPESASSGDTTGFYIVSSRDGARSQDPDKYHKDAEVLKRALETEQDPFLRSRYTFYLARSYENAGEKKQALEAFFQRAELGHWSEEVFISLYSAGHLQLELGRPVEEVIATFVRASEAAPGRAEAFHAASRLCRENRKFAEGYEYARRGLTIPLPANGLFVVTWIYEYGLLDEFAINAYWMERYQDCFDACHRLLRENKMPSDMRDRVKKNGEFAAEKIRLQGIPLAPVAEPLAETRSA